MENVAQLVKRLEDLVTTDKDIIYRTEIDRDKGKTVVWCRINNHFYFEDDKELAEFLTRKEIPYSSIKEITFTNWNPYYNPNDENDWEKREIQTGAFNVTFKDPSLEALFYSKGYLMISMRPSRDDAPFGSFG